MLKAEDFTNQAKLDMLLDLIKISDQPESGKEGYTLKPIMASPITIGWEYAPDPDYHPNQSGTYIDPIPYVAGMACTVGLFYTDGEDIWECIKSGIPSGFADTEYFEVL